MSDSERRTSKRPRSQHEDEQTSGPVTIGPSIPNIPVIGFDNSTTGPPRSSMQGQPTRGTSTAVRPTAAGAATGPSRPSLESGTHGRPQFQPRGHGGHVLRAPGFPPLHPPGGRFAPRPSSDMLPAHITSNIQNQAPLGQGVFHLDRDYVETGLLPLLRNRSQGSTTDEDLRGFIDDAELLFSALQEQHRNPNFTADLMNAMSNPQNASPFFQDLLSRTNPRFMATIFTFLAFRGVPIRPGQPSTARAPPPLFPAPQSQASYNPLPPPFQTPQVQVPYNPIPPLPSNVYGYEPRFPMGYGPRGYDLPGHMPIVPRPPQPRFGDGHFPPSTMAMDEWDQFAMIPDLPEMRPPAPASAQTQETASSSSTPQDVEDILQATLRQQHYDEYVRIRDVVWAHSEAGRIQEAATAAMAARMFLLGHGISQDILRLWVEQYLNRAISEEMERRVQAEARIMMPPPPPPEKRRRLG